MHTFLVSIGTLFPKSVPIETKKSVLCTLQFLQCGLKLKPTKCHFAMQQVTYLGHVISADGVGPDSSKIAVVADYPTPKDAKQLRQFLGLTNYYRCFVKHYTTIAKPLHEALRGKQKHFTWDQHCNEAFETLKKHLVSPPPSLLFPISVSHSSFIQTPQMWL